MASLTGGKPRVSVRRNSIIHWYVSEDKSGVETAKLLGISRSTLGRYLVRFEIPIKPVSEVMKTVRAEKYWSTKKLD